MLPRLLVAFALSASVGIPAALADQHTEDFKNAMDKMQSAMPMELSGNADADFAKAMIPHHQGAVDMAQVELKYGKDPELRKRAEKIIAEQQREISDMEAWLKEHGS